MDIHSLVSQLARFGTLETGRGPRHPESPNPDLADPIEAFLDEHPFVRRDPGYVDFLECYAGLLLWRERDCLGLSIYGFDPNVALHLTEGEGEPITPDRFLTFADVTVPHVAGVFSANDPQGG